MSDFDRAIYLISALPIPSLVQNFQTAHFCPKILSLLFIQVYFANVAL